jgi:hypothetical protein
MTRTISTATYKLDEARIAVSGSPRATLGIDQRQSFCPASFENGENVSKT